MRAESAGSLPILVYPHGYVIEIDFLENISGNDKVPNDIGQYARDALAKTGAFRAFRTLPAATASKGASGVVLPQLLRDRGTPPRPTFRLVGAIEGAEQVLVKGGDRRVDAQFGGGHTWTGETSGAVGSEVVHFGATAYYLLATAADDPYLNVARELPEEAAPVHSAGNSVTQQPQRVDQAGWYALDVGEHATGQGLIEIEFVPDSNPDLWHWRLTGGVGRR